MSGRSSTPRSPDARNIRTGGVVRAWRGPPALRHGGNGMDNRSKPFKGTTSNANDGFNLDTLLYPAKAFRHPMDVVRDADLTLNEKRAILASWASDACAVEATPALRSTASGSAVSWDEIMDALRTLDGEGEEYRKPLPHYKRVLARRRVCLPRRILFRSRKRSDEGRSLN